LNEKLRLTAIENKNKFRRLKTMFKTSVVMLLTVIAAVFMSANVSEAAKGIVEKGLVSYWSFNEGTVKGDTVSDVFGNNDGTFVGNPKIAKGKYGNAVELNGSSDYVEVPDDKSLQLWETYTLEAWIYQREIKSSRFIDRCTAGTSDGPHFDNHPGTKLRSCAGGCVTSDADFTLDEWYHVVMTFDEGAVKFYLDGSPAGEGNVASPLSGNTLSFKLGADSNGQNLLDGFIDEARIYNRAISEAEVNQNMESEGPSAVNPTNKVAATWGEIKFSR